MSEKYFCLVHGSHPEETCPKCQGSVPSNEETNRDKVLCGEPVPVTDSRLAEMQGQAIAAEGIGLMGPLHWHWASAINELIAARAELERLTRERDEAQLRFQNEVALTERLNNQLVALSGDPEQSDETGARQAPIACVTVYDGDGPAGVMLYAPGLPPGDHDLYCEPLPAPTAIGWIPWHPDDGYDFDGIEYREKSCTALYDGWQWLPIYTQPPLKAGGEPI